MEQVDGDKKRDTWAWMEVWVSNAASEKILGPITAKKKRPNPKSPEGPGFGGPTVVQSFHRREWATLCMADAYIKLGESIKKKQT